MTSAEGSDTFLAAELVEWTDVEWLWNVEVSDIFSGVCSADFGQVLASSQAYNKIFLQAL